MAINTYLSATESKKQNKQAEQKQNHRYREHFDRSVATEQSWGCKVQHGEHGQ